MDKKILEKLNDLSLQCIAYVGSANYTERELHAKRVLNRAFQEAAKGNLKGIVWFEDQDE